MHADAAGGGVTWPIVVCQYRQHVTCSGFFFARSGCVIGRGDFRVPAAVQRGTTAALEPHFAPVLCVC